MNGSQPGRPGELAQSRGQQPRSSLEWLGPQLSGETRLVLVAEDKLITEVIRPKRQTRRLKGKPDPVDAEAAARAVLAGEAAAVPKPGTDLVEIISVLRVARASYLDLFHTVQNEADRHSTSFLLTGALRPVFRLLPSAFIRRSVDELDPFLLGRYGSSMSSWVESRWLFWLDDVRSTSSGKLARRAA